MTDAPHPLSRNSLLAVAIWLVAVFYLICNLGHMQLVVEMTSDADDTAQVYYSPTTAWSEQESISLPLNPGRNTVAFPLPAFMVGDTVRFDPGRHASTYRIYSMHWRAGGHRTEVPLQRLRDTGVGTSDLISDADSLRIIAHNDDSQLLLPTPGVSSRMAGNWAVLLLIAVSLVALVCALKAKAALPKIAMMLIGTCALVYFFSSVIAGPNLPLYDDWRYVFPGPFDLIDGGWQWLRVVGNDTYFLTNQIIDYIILNLSGVDFAVLRAVAAALLLLQIGLQWRIVVKVAAHTPAVAAMAIALGIWSLSAGAFWSNAAMAYQQALPTLFGTILALMLVGRSGTLNVSVSLIALLICCIASGLSYISGGVMLTSLGLAWLLTCDWSRAPLHVRRTAVWLIAAGVFLVGLQFALVSHTQGSLLQHNHHAASVYPTDWRFWIFFLGLFGRALGYNGTSATLDILCTALVLMPAAVFGMRCIRPWLGGLAPADPAPAWTMLALYAGIGSASYAAIVAFGRAGFIDSGATVQTVSEIAKGRFHFWPIAAMLPFAWLGWAAVLRDIGTKRAVAGMAIGICMLAPKSPLPLDHVSRLRELAQISSQGARYLAAHMPDAKAGRPVICPTLTGIPLDLGPTLIHLHDRGTRLYAQIQRNAVVAGRSGTQTDE